VISQICTDEKLILFTAGLPEKLSGGNALATVVGPSQAIAGIIDIADLGTAAEALRHILHESR